MSTSPLSIRYIDQEIKTLPIKKVSGPNDYTSEFKVLEPKSKLSKVIGFLKLFILYWSIVDLQCCVSFRCTAK